MLDLIIKNGQCYISGRLENKDIAVKDGKISKIGEVSDETKEVYDAKQLELSVTLLMSLLIRFCRKSFASEPLT